MNQQTSMPLDTGVTVQSSLLVPIALSILAVILVPVGIAVLADPNIVGAMIAFPLGSILLPFLLFFLYFRTRAKGVKYLSDNSIVLANGSEIPMSELHLVEDNLRYSTIPSGDSSVGRGLVGRVKLHFSDGRTALLIPSSISNFDEVYHFVKHLPCGQSSDQYKL
ncbi:MAG: hypothetical protein WBD22_09275 [Pyrinomonadaceae bacterium]